MNEEKKSTSVPLVAITLVEKPGEETTSALFNESHAGIFWVDWREADDDIIHMAAKALDIYSLFPEWRDGNLFVRYNDVLTPVSLEFKPGEQDKTLLSLNKALAPDYEIRYVRASEGGDTIAFIGLDADSWIHLQTTYGDRIGDAFMTLTAETQLFSHTASNTPSDAQSTSHAFSNIPAIKIGKEIVLIQDYQMTVEVPGPFQTCGVNKIIPFKNGRAVIIGWGTHGLGTPGYGSVNYWAAEVRPQGISYCVLPFVVSDVNNSFALSTPLFKLGESFGVLLNTGEVLLFSGIHDAPVSLAIENHSDTISGYHAEYMRNPNHEIIPAYCGHGSGNLIPTIFAGSINDRFGRHVSLLEIKQDAMTAKWVGRPQVASPTQYIPFDTISVPGAGGRDLISGENLPPLFYDCAWIDNSWHLFAVGYETNWPRYGIPLGVLSRNHDDLSVSELLFKQKEQSLGKICASLDRMIVSPSGGKQTIFVLQDRVELPLALPGEVSKQCLQEYYDGYYWFTPDTLRSSSVPFTVMACKAL